MPSRSELIAAFRSDEEICREIGADALIYQDIDSLRAAVREVNPAISHFETSCFDGQYVTGDISKAYLKRMEDRRDAPSTDQDGDDSDGVDGNGGQLDLNLVS